MYYRHVFRLLISTRLTHAWDPPPDSRYVRVYTNALLIYICQVIRVMQLPRIVSRRADITSVNSFLGAPPVYHGHGKRAERADEP